MKDENNSSDFRPNDNFYHDDDDIVYSTYDGQEAAKIIIPVELTEEAPSQQTETVPSLSQSKKRRVTDLSSLLSLAAEYTELLGAETIKVLTFIFSKASSVLAIPFMIIASLFRKLFKKIKAMPKKIHISLADDIKKILYELKVIFSAGSKVENKKVKVILTALYKYFIISFRRHRHFWKTIFNLALPTVCIVLLFSFWNSIFHNSTFALEVFYNGTSLGYVENADVFEEGRSRALSLVATGGDEQAPVAANPVYKVRRIKINELSSSKEISESILTNSTQNYTRACGIYIDGEFLCAITNEADAVRVFDSILAPYKKEAAKGTIVGFVEEIEYVQGYYSENSNLIWDTGKLSETLAKPKTTKKYHKLKKNESLSAVAKKYSITLSELKAMNPGSDFSVGSKLLVAQESAYVRVKTMKTRLKTQLIGYETIERNSSYLTKGTKKTTQEGSYGQKVITELVTYINGKETYSTVVSEKITKNPVNKIVLIGTKTVSSTPSYTPGTSSGRFIWPTIGAYTISSYYGYRNPNISGWGWHGGIDIIRAGGYSTGTPVVAAASGTVISAVRGYSGYGHTVVINHGNGYTTRYAHMQPGSITVYVGQYVYQGQQIGRIGSTGNSTGPHLHFEVLLYGAKKNPLNYIRR